MTKIPLLSAAACALLITGCASGLSNGKTDSKRSDDAPLVTRIYSSVECPTVTKPEALAEVLAGLFLTPLIESSIKGLGEAIKKAGEDQVTTKTAKTNNHFYEVILGDTAEEETRIDQNIGCITVVHGRFSDKTGDDAKELHSKFQTRFKNVGNKLNPDDIPNYLSPETRDKDRVEFSDDIRFFSQYAVVRSDDKTAIRLEPKIVLIGAPFANPKWNSSGKRDIVLVINFKLPSQNGGGEAFAILTSKFPRVKDYTLLEGTALLGQSTGWMPLPPIPANVMQRITANAKRRIDLQSLDDLTRELAKDLQASGLKQDKRKALEKQKASAERRAKRLRKLIDADQTVVGTTAPVTISVSVVETQDGNKFLVSLGSYLSENNKEIAKPIFEAIDPSTRKTAKATEADAEDTLRIAAIEAVVSYEAEDAKTGSERDEAKIRVSKIKAKQACRKLEAAGHEDISCINL